MKESKFPIINIKYTVKGKPLCHEIELCIYKSVVFKKYLFLNQTISAYFILRKKLFN